MFVCGAIILLGYRLYECFYLIIFHDLEIAFKKSPTALTRYSFTFLDGNVDMVLSNCSHTSQ